MKVTVIAVSVPALKEVSSFFTRYASKYPEDSLEFSGFYIAGMEQKYKIHPEILTDALGQADIAVVDTMGASETLQEIVRQGLEECRGQRIVIGNTLREYIRLGSFSMGAMNGMMKKKENAGEKEASSRGSAQDKMHRMRRMALMMGNVLPFGITKDMKNVFLLIDYWQQATEEDIESFLHLLLRRYGGKKFLPKEKPCTMRYGIYLKDPFTLQCENSLEKFLGNRKSGAGKDTVAVLFYGHSYPNDFLPVVRAVCRELEDAYRILPIAFSQNEDGDQEKLRSYLCQKKFPVRAVISLMPFRLGAGPMGGDADGAVEILKELNVPYLKPFCLTKVSEEEWREADAVNPGEFLISILLPELDGGIDTFPVGVMSQGRDDTGLPELVPIPERIRMLRKRLEGLTALQKKKNGEKKLAVIFYNYPPGESNVFGGAFLDTFASASAFLTALRQAGYRVNEMTAEELRKVFVEDGRCNRPEWCDEADTEFVCLLDGKEYPVKGIRNGNVFLGLQPLREGYHDRNQTPPEAYRAFYRWIQEELEADAVIHFGTHGTLEFLPGKDNGMMGTCWPDRLIGQIPHFYYYYIGNPSEAMTAKRRAHATLVSYQAPPLQKSGLYGELAELKETIAEYRESLQSAPERSGDLLARIRELAEDSEITESAGAQNGTQEGFLDSLEKKLYRYENSLITKGLHMINEEELQGMLHGLEGGYLPAGTAGDVIKNPDILPSGRNLVQFDPRLVPTRVAYERGARAAELAMQKYRAEKGRWPETTAVILWGLETSRSQGETVGQILYDLGLRLKTEKGSYDDRLEVIPMEELGRPRVDVVIHICGFFRDMYPNLIENLNEMLQQLLKREEADEDNYYARNTRRMAQNLLEEAKAKGSPMDENTAWELASCRIFGPKEGEYATRLTDTVRNGSWREAAELGASFTEDLSYGYTCRQKGVAMSGVLAKEYEQVEVISQIRNNAEYELTDLDHYYEFYGGLSKAVENCRGKKPVMLVADTAGQEVEVDGIEEALQRGITARLLNPSWIEGMMQHEYHGVQQIAKRFENVMGFAASTDAVSSRTFSRMAQCYAGDEKLRHRMQQSNRWAYMKMMERLMEAENRGYYQADEEELAMIRDAYLEAEGDAER